MNLYRRPADAVFLIGGLGGILAGYAVHAWFVAPWERHGLRLVVIVASVVAIAFGAAVLFGLNFDRLGRVAAPAASAAMWLAAAIVALAFAAPRIALQPKLAAGALALVATLDLGINNGPSSSSALPPATFEALQPATGNAVIASLKKRVVRDAQRRDRIELAGLGFHWPNASMTHRLENTLGYNPVRLGHYSRATGAEDHIGLPDQRKFSALMPSYKSMLADMLGLRWIATPVPVSAIDKLARPDELPLVDRPAGAYIYENPTALPRVLFAANAQVANFEEILKSGRWPNFDPRSTVLLEAVAKVGAPRQPGTARLVRYGQTRIEIEVSSADGGWVVLNDVWHPWWSATVAGQPATIERANVLFRAVEVKPGTHAVVMEFRPLNGIWRDLRRSSTDPRDRRP